MAGADTQGMGIGIPLEARPRHLTASQRRAIAATETLLGDGDVRAFAAGRAQARMSVGAQWMIGIFSVAFAGALVLFHVILLPGILLGYVLYDAIRPRRGVAVTGSAVAELRLGGLNGTPRSVIAVVDHGALAEHRATRQGHRIQVSFAGETVSLTERHLRLLTEAVPAHGALPPPPMPGTPAPSSSPDARATIGALPRWRRDSIGWILAHLAIALAIFVAFIGVAYLVTGVLHRDANRTSPTGVSILWVTLVAVLIGWFLFVYVPASSFIRKILLATLVGGALVFTCVVDVVCSPAIAS